MIAVKYLSNFLKVLKNEDVEADNTIVHHHNLLARLLHWNIDSNININNNVVDKDDSNFSMFVIVGALVVIFIVILTSIPIISSLYHTNKKNQKGLSPSSSSSPKSTTIFPMPPNGPDLSTFLKLKADDQLPTVQKYGDIFTIPSPQPRLIPNIVAVSHPSLVKYLTIECTKNNNKSKSSSTNTNTNTNTRTFDTRDDGFAKATQSVVGIGVTGLKGDEWSWRKKALIREFHKKKLLNAERGLLEVVTHEGERLCRSLQQYVHTEGQGQGQGQGEVVQVDYLTTAAAVGVVLYTLLGREIDFDCDEFRQSAKDLMDCLGKNIFDPTYKLFKYIPYTSAWSMEQKKYHAWKVIDDVVGAEIDLLLEEYKGTIPTHPDRKPGSVIASLIEQEERFRIGGKNCMIAEARVFVQAGFETTAHSLAFSMAMMAERPDLASDMAKEVRDVMMMGASASADTKSNGGSSASTDNSSSKSKNSNNNHPISMDDITIEMIREAIDNVSSVKNFFMESLRLYPLAPALGGSVVETMTLNHDGTSYTLPKGTSVQFLNVPLQRHAEAVHDKTNGSEIIPERWDVPNVKDKPFLHTFQNGPHACPGKSLSLLEGHVFLMLVVLMFEFEFPKGVTKVEFDHNLLLRPKDGMPLIVKSRKW